MKLSIKPLIYRFFLSIIILIIYSFKATKTEPMQIVKNVDLERYSGTWYEIARFPHRFEKDLVGVTATYTLTGGKYIKVLNQGYKNTLDGKLKQAKGKAKLANKDITGHLKVSFFLCFYADYYILELDETNYQYALVGSSSMNYLWIMNRTPQMDEAIYNDLLLRAKNRGYDINKLEKVLQK